MAVATAVVPLQGKVDAVKPYVCQVCARSYERQDHLSRHLDSHRNERSYRCSECPRAFNRRDLLLRHANKHAAQENSDSEHPGKTSLRAIKACDACVASKVKCQDSRPCKRCEKRKIPCTTESQARPAFHRAYTTPALPTAGSSSGLPDHAPQPASSLASDLQVEQTLPAVSSTIPQNDMTWTPMLANGAFDHFDNIDNGLVPSFFEHIMVPGTDFLGTDTVNAPPNITDLFPEQDWLGDVDIFGSDFVPTVDEVFNVPDLSFQPVETPVPPVTASTPVGPSVDSANLSRTEHARKRHAIFQRSPWLYIPQSRENAFSEHHDIRLDESNLHSAASPHQPLAETLTISDKLSMRSRDSILQLVIKTAKSQVSIPSFPSAETLELLMKIGIAKRLETDAWIHPYTFRSEDTRPELLTALVAAGCVCFGVKSVSRTGLVLLEIVRVALGKLVEEDSSVVRDLQYLQASMICLDVAAFCGYKRKMEIAEGNLQPLVTALRRFGKFDRVTYPKVMPPSAETSEGLEEAWRRWVFYQSYTRLAHHILEHDTLMAHTKHRQPLISYAELSLPLPASRKAWLAPSAAAWREIMLEQRPDDNGSRASVRTIMADNTVIEFLPQTLDRRMAISACISGLSAQVWEYNQQTLLYGGEANSPDPSASLWLQARHQKLVQALKVAFKNIPEDSPTINVELNFLLASLHVNIDEVMRFAGKCGEEEAHRAFQVLQRWQTTKEARIAVFHAAQSVRWARATPPYQLRGPDALLTYHSVMVLWAFAMMQTNAARRTARSSPVPGAQHSANEVLAMSKPRVMLDGPRSAETESYIQNNTGRPCMQLRRQNELETSLPKICDLHNPQAVMLVGIGVLEGNCPGEERAGMPQMLRSLSDLMSELGALK